MNRSILFAVILFCSSSLIGAENVSLSGRVVEKGTSTGIPDVSIALKSNSQRSTTTRTDGSFSISYVKTINSLRQKSFSQKFTLKNNCLVFSPTSIDISAKVDLFTGNGKIIKSFTTGNLHKGEQNIALPKLSSGVTYIRIKMGNESYTGTLFSLGNTLSIQSMNAGTGIDHSSITQAAASIADTIIASKIGYVTQKVSLQSYTQDNISIELEKSSIQDYTDISLLTNTIQVTGDGATVNGTEVTISSSGTYHIHGTLTDGRIIVSTKDKNDVVLILNNVTIGNSKTSPLFIENAKNTIIELASGSTNTISDASNYTTFYEDDEPNATIFSKDELTIQGSGTLKIQAKYKDAIAGKDGLTITGGNFIINVADDGIRGKDNLIIQGGTFNITAGGDGLKSTDSGDTSTGYIAIEDGNFEITAAKDGIQAVNYIEISGGEFNITTGGGSSKAVASTSTAKGIKATNGIKISGGTFIINSADDAIHTNGNCTIGGGTFTIQSADDGVHADSVLTINKGDINVTKSYEGLEALRIIINGGRIVLVASDDGINVAGGNDGSGGWNPRGGGGTTNTSSTTKLLQINGGFVAVYAGGDGLDSNGSIEINGGTTLVHGPQQGANGVLDIGEGGGTFTVNGGFLLGAGTSSMTISISQNSKQNCLTAFVSQNANTLINLQNSSGKSLFTFSPAVSYGYVVFSSPDLVNGTYTFSYGGSVSNGTKDNGLYSDETYTGGTALSSDFTISSRITSIGRSSGGGGGPIFR